MKHDVFDLSDATIRDTPYVTVRRIAPRAGSRCVYQKVFKRDIEFGDFSYWTERENDFLWLFSRAKARHVVEPQQFSFEPATVSVNTFDAGITIGDWLRVRPCFDDGTTLSHPFQRTKDFLRLIRACLVALEEIHRHQVVHCDIKDDNICLPYAPCPYREGEPIRLDFDGLRLIDFAFAITPNQRLVQPLPIEPNAPYQSIQLKTAIREDIRNKSVSAVQRLDYRVDLYSLGHMGERFLDGGLIPAPGTNAEWMSERVRKLVYRLKAFGEPGKSRASEFLPHGALIADIDDALKKLGASNDVLEFSVAGLWTPQEVERGLGGVHRTPVTPIASPVAGYAPTVPDNVRRESRQPPRRIASAVAAAAVLAGVGFFLFEAARDLALFPTDTKDAPVVAVEAKPVPVASTEPATARDASDTMRLANQLRSDDKKSFAKSFQELVKLASDNVPGAAELAARTVSDYGKILMSSDPAETRHRALTRLALAARGGSKSAAQRVEAFENAYDETKATIVRSAWWLHGEGARPQEAPHWLQNGMILAAAGDRPAMLDQAYAIGHGRGLEQDRAQSVRLYRQVIERSGGEDAFSKTLRTSAVRGLSAMLNAVVSRKDHTAAVGLQSQMEATAHAGAADMQYYLGLFSECVADPPDFGVARQWYRKAAMNVAWKNPAERKLASLGKWCPLNTH